MPIRQSAFGRVRVAGAYAFYGTGTGTAKALSIDVLALLDGRSNAIVAYYLNDDLMAPVRATTGGRPALRASTAAAAPIRPTWCRSISASGSTPRPPIPRSRRPCRCGTPITAATASPRCCCSARRPARGPAGDFPNGLPTPSAVIDAQLIYDPRDVGQTQGDKSTYVFSDNPILCLLAYLTDANGGMGLNYARFIEPAIDFWKAAADECDGLVATSGMHATLLDAAAVGDNKIFLADTTGLSVGMTVQLPTENVTVSGFGLAGEVDITGTLANAHAAGELAYWPGFGQTVLYRCAGPTPTTPRPATSSSRSWLDLRRLARPARRRRLGGADEHRLRRRPWSSATAISWATSCSTTCPTSRSPTSTSSATPTRPAPSTRPRPAMSRTMTTSPPAGRCVRTSSTCSGFPRRRRR
jgi:hypothetical protein